MSLHYQWHLFLQQCSLGTITYAADWLRPLDFVGWIILLFVFVVIYFSRKEYLGEEVEVGKNGRGVRLERF